MRPCLPAAHLLRCTWLSSVVKCFCCWPRMQFATLMYWNCRFICIGKELDMKWNTAEDELNTKVSGVLCVVSCRHDFQSVKCLLKLKSNSVSWDWEPGTAVFDALLSEEEIACKQWLLAASTIHYSCNMPSEEKNIMQLASLQSVYSITVAQCYGMDFVPFELTANCLALFFLFIWYQNWTKKPLETGKKIWFRIPCSLVRRSSWEETLWSHSLFRQWLWDDTAMPHENQTPSATTLYLSISAFPVRLGLRSGTSVPDATQIHKTTTNCFDDVVKKSHDKRLKERTSRTGWRCNRC